MKCNTSINNGVVVIWGVSSKLDSLSQIGMDGKDCLIFASLQYAIIHLR